MGPDSVSTTLLPCCDPMCGQRVISDPFEINSKERRWRPAAITPALHRGPTAGDLPLLVLPLFRSSTGSRYLEPRWYRRWSPLQSSWGGSTVGEHGARIFCGPSIDGTGAQWFGSPGLSVDRVNTFGRWLSRPALRTLDALLERVVTPRAPVFCSLESVTLGCFVLNPGSRL